MSFLVAIRFWLPVAISGILAPSALALNFDGAPRDYKQVTVFLDDGFSGVNLSITYGFYLKNPALSLCLKDEPTPRKSIELTEKQVKDIHEKLGQLIENFSLKDDPDQKTYQERADDAKCAFEVRVITQETSVTLGYSHRDHKRMQAAARLYLDLIALFPDEYKNKISWASSFDNTPKTDSE